MDVLKLEVKVYYYTRKYTKNKLTIVSPVDVDGDGAVDFHRTLVLVAGCDDGGSSKRRRLGFRSSRNSQASCLVPRGEYSPRRFGISGGGEIPTRKFLRLSSL